MSESASDARDALLLAVARVRAKLKRTAAYAPVTDEGEEEDGRGGVDDGEESSGGFKDEVKSSGEDAAMSTWALCMAHRTSLSTVTLFATCLTVLRVARQLLLPLAAVDAELTVDQIGAVTAASYLSDFLLFPFSGLLMDGKGRKFASAATSLGYAIGFLILTFAKQSGGAFLLYIGGIALGAGNGLSSGLVMTLGSDIAPVHKQQR